MTSRTLHSFACGTLLLLATAGARAFVIEDNMDATVTYPLGYTDAFPWTRTVFGGTEMSVGGGILSMSTNPHVGVWFGNGSLIGHYPGWSFGSNAQGTYVSISMQLSVDAADWSLYFLDGSGYEAALQWNPTGNYDAPVQHGFNFLHADDNNAAASGYRPLDLSGGFHTFEVLARGGQVSYAVDHHLVYSGAAYYAGPTDLLVIGDGSAYDPTGIGTMLVDRVVVEIVPTMGAISTVPLPASAPLLAGALALVATGARRRGARQAAVSA